MNSIKIYGFGWVGKSVARMFKDHSKTRLAPIIQDPSIGFVSESIADVAFVCVPTPAINGKLDCSIVEDVVRNAKEDLIVIRSTVMPGTSDYLANKYKKRIVFQPEYLGETINHPLLDQGERSFIIIGGKPEDRRQLIELYQSVYNANLSIRQVTTYEAEVIKLTENRAIAFKVAQCQELYDACEGSGIDYYTIRDAVYGDDPRFNLWFTFVYPNNRGFNSSKCLSKDVPAWAAWAESVGIAPELTKGMLSYNDKL